MHGQCPIGKESWCYFQRGLANGTKCSTKYAGVSNDVLNKIKPVYLELCDKQILNVSYQKAEHILVHSSVRKSSEPLTCNENAEQALLAAKNAVAEATLERHPIPGAQLSLWMLLEALCLNYHRGINSPFLHET
ncbi:hypothetical protein TNCV_487511 [Trichonephila clavipes]|nr:hypothetical protein TNCV_487511 [Trichonephila clavipes]